MNIRLNEKGNHLRYYIADCHFFHSNLIEAMDMRPFSSGEEMNEYMIKRWNSRVQKRDEVIVLGDFSLGNGEETNKILQRLNGQIYLIEGNHDRRFLDDKNFDSSRFEWVKQYAELHDNKRKIILMHYPVFCYNGQFRRRDGIPTTYMLHGHIHNTPDQKLIDSFVGQTCSTPDHSKAAVPGDTIPCQMINCFCMYSDYVPLTLEEWIDLDENRRKAI